MSIVVPVGGWLLTVGLVDYPIPAASYTLAELLALVESTLNTADAGHNSYTVRLDTTGFPWIDYAADPPASEVTSPTNHVLIHVVNLDVTGAFWIRWIDANETDPTINAQRLALRDALGFQLHSFNSPAVGPFTDAQVGAEEGANGDPGSYFLGSELPTDGVPYVAPPPTSSAAGDTPWDPGPGRSTMDGGPRMYGGGGGGQAAAPDSGASIVVPVGGWLLRIQLASDTAFLPTTDLVVAAGTYTITSLRAAVVAALNGWSGASCTFTLDFDTTGFQTAINADVGAPITTDTPTNFLLLHGVGPVDAAYGGFSLFWIDDGDADPTRAAQRLALRDALGFQDPGRTGGGNASLTDILIDGYGYSMGPPWTSANFGYYLGGRLPEGGVAYAAGGSFGGALWNPARSRGA